VRDDWVRQSPWALPVITVTGDLVVRNQLHFLETGSPLFWMRALHIGRVLSRTDPRLEWAQHCLADAVAQLDALISRPPKEKHWNSIIKALGFSMRPNHNPFREIRRMLEKDTIYAAVLQHGGRLSGEDGALSTVAEKFKVSKSKVRGIYYAAKKLVDRLDKRFSMK
jgi:hypothetical protein